MRGGSAYVAGLRDGRAIFLDGARVDDVTTHPAFAEPVRRIAERYDAAAASDVTTCVDPASGRRIGAMWLIPRSAEDLGRRRAVHRFWAEGSYGLMGRTPDHVASVLTAFAGWRQLFDRADRRFGDNVVRFYEKAHTERYYQSAASGARERIKLLKLIWDFIGTEYGGRQLQYEMFYSAAQPVVNRRMYRAYDWHSAKAMVDRLLGEY